MKNIKILDCTLRDGGYINNWNFGKKAIHDIISNLEKANIEIIECGFLRPIVYNNNTSVFSSTSQIENIISPKSENSMYVAMIELHNYNNNMLDEYNGKSIDGIRLTFRKNEWLEAREVAKEIIEKGYKLFIQPVGTCTYTDDELLYLLEEVNKLKPYAFYLVDTLGMLYRDDVRRFFYIIDNNLSENIYIGFHSHNNLQLSFSNAQELIWLKQKRAIIVDTSVYGMGRGVGNLATELFVDYINKNIEQRYSIIPILNIADKYLMSIYSQQKWGYDLPYFLSAIVKCHPNYAAHLIKKQTLSIDKIEKILCLIPIKYRDEYNQCLIEKLYYDMQNCKIDDSKSISKLKTLIEKKEVLIIGSGLSIKNSVDKIRMISEKAGVFVISINFYARKFNVDSVFMSNERRYRLFKDEKISNVRLLKTSNLSFDSQNDEYVFDYTNLLGEGASADNAGAMLVRLLKKVGVSKIFLAGFDGFDVDTSLNYFSKKYKSDIDFETAKKKNNEVSRQLKLALNDIEYEVITKTKYEI